MWECYLPLVDWLERTRVGVTLSVSPPLVAMLRHEGMRERTRHHVDALRELNRRLAPDAALEHHYDTRLHKAREALDDCVWRRMLRLPGVQRITTSATHGFLPGLDPSGGSRSQIALGRALVPTESSAFWLPECAWSPTVDRAAHEEGVGAVVVDEHALPPGQNAVVSSNGVVCFSRDRDACLRVWSSRDGYPSHANYREFYRDVGFDLPSARLGPFASGTMTGLKFHRVTDGVLGAARRYDPERAHRTARDHAHDFARRLRELDGPRILAFDAELFGHWWHEGVVFLEHFASALANHDIALVPLDELRRGDLPMATPCPSTWGRGGFSRDWMNEATARWWRELHRVTRSVTHAVKRQPSASGVRGLALDHAIEAVLLSQSSDWLYMMSGDHRNFARDQIDGALRRTRRWLEVAAGSPAKAGEEQRLRGQRAVTSSLDTATLRAGWLSR